MSMLRKVLPRLIVHRHQDLSANITEQTSSLLATHGDLDKRAFEISRISLDGRIHPSGANIEQGDLDVEFLTHLSELLDVDGVAGKVYGVGESVCFAEIWRSEDKAGAFIRARPFISWVMHSGCCGDLEGLQFWRLATIFSPMAIQIFIYLAANVGLYRFPRLQPVDSGPWRKFLRAIRRGEDAAAVEQPTTQLI